VPPVLISVTRAATRNSLGLVAVAAANCVQGLHQVVHVLHQVVHVLHQVV